MDSCVIIPEEAEWNLLSTAEQDELKEKLSRQLWSVEAAPTGIDKFYIRAICTELVIKKVIDSVCKGHSDQVYTGQCGNIKHFDLALVTFEECVGTSQFNVNDCMWEYDVLP